MSTVQPETPVPPSAGVMPHHAHTTAQVVNRFNSNETTGLTPEEFSRRFAEYGPNELPKPKGDSVWSMIWRQINNPLIWVLIASGILAVIMGKKVDGAVVLGVVALNTLIGFIQEYKAGKSIASLMELVSENATVIRGGQHLTIPSRELVPGDIVLLQSGDKVPADCRLIKVKNLKIEEAALTGESVPSEKSSNPVSEKAVLGDRKNMAYSGTLVTYGTATAIIIGTGKDTELGKISALLSSTTRIETPLTKSLESVSKWLTVGIVIVSLALFGVSLARGYPLVDAILAAITLAVAAIPEGLPAIITIALAIGVRRMAARRAVIRQLPAVETLGSTTVICSDKTGTLTKNEMTVQAIWAPSGSFAVTGVGYAPIGQVQEGGARVTNVPADIQQLLLGGVLCNDATVKNENNKYAITGDPTEAALLVSAEKAGIVPDAMRARYPRVDAIPFESERQLMATMHMGNGSNVIFVKGAPEVIVKRCSRQADGKSLDAARILREVEHLASQGMRVLAVAAKNVPLTQRELKDEDIEDELIFFGLQGMIDPPRPEAIAAVAHCKEAGIIVKMITGDHRGTAEAVGRELGLIDHDHRAITGAELAEMDDAALSIAVIQTNIFARVAPDQKLRIVRSLQAQDHIVSMTGDGVNDAPALKQANIGVAMGITGTAVSKEAAAMVLIDDNFASLAAAVEEGRRVFDNLVKSLAFVLPTNIGEALIIFVAVLFFPFVNGAPLMPIAPVQILWINLVATVALALPLAFEAMEPDIMLRKPRKQSEPLLSAFVVRRTFIVGTLMTAAAVGLFWFQYYGTLNFWEVGEPVGTLAQAQTMAVLTVILMQVFYLLNCRSLKDSMFKIGLFSNNTVYAGIVAIIALQAAYIYVPFMQVLFGSAPLSLASWGIATLVAFSVVPIMSVDKWVAQRYTTRAATK